MRDAGRGGEEGGEGQKAGEESLALDRVWGAGRAPGTRLKWAYLRGGRWTSTVLHEQWAGPLWHRGHLPS